MIAKLKAAKVTTVIFAGDPVTPVVAHEGGDRAELLPRVGRARRRVHRHVAVRPQYDQKQWAHAFGVSTLPTPVTPEADQLYSILVWQSGKGPEAKTFKVLVQAPLIFYTALHLAGPDLTAADVPRRAVPLPVRRRRTRRDLHLSWGNHDIWPTTDFFGSDDATLIWWNPNGQGRRRGRQRGQGDVGVRRRGQALPPGPVAERRAGGVRRVDLGD